MPASKIDDVVVGIVVDLRNTGFTFREIKEIVSRDIRIMSERTVRKAYEVSLGEKTMPTNLTLEMRQEVVQEILKDPERSAVEVGSELGVSAHAVQALRFKLFQQGVLWEPVHPGMNSVMLAKTCKACDLFLPAKFFKGSSNPKYPSSRWTTTCISCRRKGQRPAGAGKSEWMIRADEITAQTAVNSGKPWTEQDIKRLKIMDRKNIPVIRQAIELGRMYQATCKMRGIIGIQKKQDRHGDVASQQWIIRFEKRAA